MVSAKSTISAIFSSDLSDFNYSFCIITVNVEYRSFNKRSYGSAIICRACIIMIRCETDLVINYKVDGTTNIITA